MPRSVALIIGVSKVPRLPQLTGVQRGLDSFQEWALEQGFEVERFDDSSGRPVEMRPLQDVIHSAIESGDVERLFVYFSGHGLVLAPRAEYWLLSRVATYDSEAVNVASSVDKAYYCGIRHVAFFSDACRSFPEGPDYSGIEGASIFPTCDHEVDLDHVEVDMFHATSFAQPAFEVHSWQWGIFSRCLLRALKGEDPEAVSVVQDGDRSHAILAPMVAKVLRTQVRRMAEEVGVVQKPLCIPGSYWPDKVLAWVPPSAASLQPALPDTPH